MTDIAIRVENLFKLYQIGAAQERHDSQCLATNHTKQTKIRGQLLSTTG